LASFGEQEVVYNVEIGDVFLAVHRFFSFGLPLFGFWLVKELFH